MMHSLHLHSALTQHAPLDLIRMQHEEHELLTGFFPEESTRGFMMLEEVNVMANDVSNDTAFNLQLHPRLRSGRFEVWPRLSEALDELREAAKLKSLIDEWDDEVHASGDEQSFERWMALCEQGALCFLRRAGLDAGLGCPLFDWPLAADARTCQRFGGLYASYIHTDMRVDGLEMLNIWVPVAEANSEPLLLFAANATVDRAWSEPSDKPYHCPPCYADAGSWYFWRDIAVGEALVFPGDGGDAAGTGVFHGSASEARCRRLSFDARELFDASATSARALADAEARLARETAEWEARVDKAMAGGMGG